MEQAEFEEKEYEIIWKFPLQAVYGLQKIS